MTALVVLNRTGARLARRLAGTLPQARVHGWRPRVPEASVSFPALAPHLRHLFAAGTPIVAICASGIVIRALAPVLTDKQQEPPVVIVSADGGFAVPLLGGHRGGNRLAQRIAALTGGAAVITTASDRGGHAPDDPPPGWTVANPARARPVAAALADRRPVAMTVEAGDPAWLGLEARAGAGGDTPGTPGVPGIWITDRAVPAPDDRLLLHPPSLAVGVGCERGTPPPELTGLVRDCLHRAGLASASVACVVSIDLKADEPAVAAVAAMLGAPARFFDAAALRAVRHRLTDPSPRVMAATGTPGVAEAAALAAVGPAGALVLAKTRSRRATCAIARHPGGLVPARIGRPAGRLTLVGLGPGDPEQRTPAATAALHRADHLVGYSRYLDLVAGVGTGRRHPFPLGAETERCRHAIALAAAGAEVALLGSGDAGIYAMASLVLEWLETAPRRLRLAVVPGVSAMQVAAARAGAPLGHDFCAISLSDCLTPWPVIEARLAAAAAGDFVVALYNPVSRTRRHPLNRARDILLGHRPAETPVVVGRQLGRAGETVRLLRLAALTDRDADMLSVVLVGSRATRVLDTGVQRWVYTPRGYDPAAARPEAARSETARPEAARPEATCPETPRPGPAQPGPGRAGPGGP